MNNQGFCRSCGVCVEWAVTTNGKRMPLDEEPDCDGLMVLTAAGVAEFYDPDRHEGALRRTSHFATCVDAKRWRKRHP